jgi:hypothetical protein
LRLDANFVGLNLPKVTRLGDEVVMDDFGVVTSAIKPGTDGLRMEAKGVLNGDEGTAPGD